jgi:hypothetical protein
MVTEAAEFTNSDEARIEAAKRIGLLFMITLENFG